jgi:S1-C subfamily serine protease
VEELSSYDEKDVLDILEKVSKSVVNISTIKLVHHMFYQVVPVEGMGSGTIVDPKGYVLTNNLGRKNNWFLRCSRHGCCQGQ